MSDEIEMTPCKSSQVHSIGYQPSSRTLAVRFKGGGATYHYADVPPDAWEALRQAESMGKHIHAHVKGKYPHTRIEDKKA